MKPIKNQEEQIDMQAMSEQQRKREKRLIPVRINATTTLLVRDIRTADQWKLRYEEHQKRY